jgi:hypothetical protein
MKNHRPRRTLLSHISLQRFCAGVWTLGPTPLLPACSLLAGARCQSGESARSRETSVRFDKPDQHPRTCDFGIKVHFGRFDSLLTPLPRCFSHFPHGTFLLSELHVNNQALEGAYPLSSRWNINQHYSLHRHRDGERGLLTRLLRSVVPLFQVEFGSPVTHTPAARAFPTFPHPRHQVWIQGWAWRLRFTRSY